MRYNNYHKHTHYSNVSTPDVVVKPIDYINRMKELGHNIYFTTEHRYGGNPWEAYDLCKENNFKMVYAVEAYYVDNRFEKDKNNYHIILVALNINGFKEINKIISEANKSGYYYKPRIDLELLLSLNPNNVIITTACVAGRLSGINAEEAFLKPVLNHFGNHLYLEVQSHISPIQAEYNKKIIQLSNKYNIPIIHANDSHYIYPEQSKDRDLFLKGKGIDYPEESDFILDYPDSDEILRRYKEQGVLSQEQALEALKNTLIFDECQDLGFNKEIKMPKLYPDKDSNELLTKIVYQEWEKEKQNISKERIAEHEKAIQEELDIVKKTNMADYFILDYEIVKKAKNNYGAVLTKTGRGSAVSFYINKLLGFTEIDRVESPVTLYPTRFMSVSRILEARTLPDIDLNWSNVEPVIKASKDILGEDNVYYMVAYGTMKESAAFRNLCRAKGLKMEEYNEIAKDLETYSTDPKWKDLIEESKKYIGVIDSISPSPCSFLLLSQPISEEIGLIRVGDEICCNIDGITADTWKYLKNDYLTVKVWDIIDKTFKLIGKPIPNVRELNKLLDDRVWQLYEKGLTATLNQADSDFATPLFMKYKPRSVADMCAMVAALRPGFASLLDNFINRKEYTTGVKELDELLSDSFHYMMYQEGIMKYLIWLGVPEDETYSIIKKIAKKKFKEEELKELKTKLIKGWLKNIGTEEGFEETWSVVEDSSRYSFNASHSLCVGYDSLYGAYLKANYPLEYYTVVLNMYNNDIEETDKIIKELPYFGIQIKPVKFRYSKGEYFFDKETNTIYKGIGSIKFLNNTIGEELYNLRDKHYNSFIDLLIDLTENTSINTRQIEILIKLNYFDEFGNNGKLYNIFNEFINGEHKYKKTYVDKTKQKRIAELKEIEKNMEDTKLPIKEQLEFEKEILGYPVSTYKLPKSYVYILDIDKKYSPKVTCYCLANAKSEVMKIPKEYYNKHKIEQGDIIIINKFKRKPKLRKTENGFEPIEGEFEWWIEDYSKKELK